MTRPVEPACARSSYTMRIELEEPPEPPVWPEGVQVRAGGASDARDVYELYVEAFAGQWDFHAESLEEWRRWSLEGWISILGVRQGMRGRGLGLALLRASFGGLFRRGRRIVELGVDAANPTGAVRLYERAGMHVARRSDTLERPL